MIKTRRTKRTFSLEFRLEAIEQVVKYQRDVREVALALELNPDHLRKWIRLYKQELRGIEPAGNAILTHQLSSPPQAGQHSSSGRITRVSRGSEAGNGLRAEDWRRADGSAGSYCSPSVSAISS